MDVQLARAVANALWPAWRRDRWRTYRCVRDMARSNPMGYSPLRSGSIAIASAASTTVVTYEEAWLEGRWAARGGPFSGEPVDGALLLAEEWPGVTCRACGGRGREPVGTASAWDEPFEPAGACCACGGRGVVSASYIIRLSRAAHDAALLLMPDEWRVALLAARRSTARMPFEVTMNRHGRSKLRRNSHDSLITPSAASALEAVAGACTLAGVSEDVVNAFLLGDDPA